MAELFRRLVQIGDDSVIQISERHFGKMGGQEVQKPQSRQAKFLQFAQENLHCTAKTFRSLGMGTTVKVGAV
jgi:hypothetical protein